VTVRDNPAELRYEARRGDTLLGQIRYHIEGVPEVFIANEGDVVYVPKQHWHLASAAGDGLACRLAMNAFNDLGHSYEAEPAAAPPAPARGQ